jgi:hypothetical protein
MYALGLIQLYEGKCNNTISEALPIHLFITSCLNNIKLSITTNSNDKDDVKDTPAASPKAKSPISAPLAILVLGGATSLLAMYSYHATYVASVAYSSPSIVIDAGRTYDGRRVLFDNSMFNVVIENVKYNNWYNKIGDNFATKTVPIYWGCPNIEEFGYDERGIIRFDSPEELCYIINTLTPEKYNQMLPYIEYNYQVVKQDTFENNISQFLNSFIEINNL